MKKLTFKGGVYPPEGKELARDIPFRECPPGDERIYPLSQHIGKPAKPIVAKGDRVLAGQRIAEADGFVSAHIFCSVSGKVKALENRPDRSRFIGTRTWSTNAAQMHIFPKRGWKAVCVKKNDRGEGIDTVYFVHEKEERPLPLQP